MQVDYHGQGRIAHLHPQNVVRAAAELIDHRLVVEVAFDQRHMLAIAVPGHGQHGLNHHVIVGTAALEDSFSRQNRRGQPVVDGPTQHAIGVHLVVIPLQPLAEQVPQRGSIRAFQDRLAEMGLIGKRDQGQ